MNEEYRNLVEVYQRSCRAYAARPLFGTRRNDGWSWIRYGDFESLVDRFRNGLASLGIREGDRVAIVSNNRVEWAVAAYAAYGLEAAVVPLYESQQPTEWEFILADSGARLVVGSTPRVDEALLGIRNRIPGLEHVIGMELPAEDPRSFRAVLERGAGASVPARQPSPATVSGFIYTSGTTGNPKGVVLTHANVASNITAVHRTFVLDPEDRSLSFLPWAHSLGQNCELHNLVSMGCSIALNDDVKNLARNLGEVRPTVLFAVPLIFNRIHTGVQHQMAERPRAVRRLFEAGIRDAVRRSRGEALGPAATARLWLADRLIFSKIRARFGGRLKYAISGSAALDRGVAEFFDALGIAVYEGYGLTETSPIVSANCPGHRRLGSVGRPIPGVRVEIDHGVSDEPGEGEIIVYGPNVMRGYHDRPEENRAAFTADGGLRTGDLGRLDGDGYLWVTGRIKEQYKLANGKYVMPSVLEEHLKLSPYVANVMVYGDNRPYNVALVVADRAAIDEWARQSGIDLAGTVEDERVRGLIEREIASLARSFKGFEKIASFRLVGDDFTIDNGLLTPTFKLKRRNVLARYGDQLEALYAAAGNDRGFPKEAAVARAK